MSHKKSKPAEIADRQSKAMQLRVRGFSFPKIAKALGCSTGTAFNDYTAAMKRLAEETKESADQVRSVELARLDKMTRALEFAAFGESPDDSPNALDIKAIDALLKVSDRRAKLLGLDAPEDINLNVGEVTPEMAAQKVREKFGNHAAKREPNESAEPESQTDS